MSLVAHARRSRWMEGKRACSEKMRGENYRFIFIGSIVSVLFLYIFSIKTILLTTFLLLGLWAVWNFRNELGIQRRLLQSGLTLGLAHKSNRVSRCTSNFSTKSKTQEGNGNRSTSSCTQETFSEALFNRRKQTSKPIGYDFTKSFVPNVGFTSLEAFAFGSPRSVKDSVSQQRAKESPFMSAATARPNILQRNTHLLEEKKISDEDTQEFGTPGYIFHPTRRLLSVARRYPTHQPRYRQLGSFPSVHLSPCPKAILSGKSGMGQHTPVTIRIAPPTVFTPSPIKLSYSASPSSVKDTDQPDPCDPRTVVAALKENSRKRLLREETGDYDPKRQRCDSSSNSSLSGSNLGELERLNPMEEGDLEPLQSLASKRPATPGPMADHSPGVVQKRHRNNAILSSYSSTKRTAKQMSESLSPVTKQVKISSPVKDRFCQTESPWPTSVQSVESSICSPGHAEPAEEHSATNREGVGAEGTPPTRKSPFPALKEGFSPRQNIAVYADIGKSSKFVYNMPGYLPTLEDYQQDKRIEQERLNHLLFGSKKGPDSKTADANKGANPPRDQNSASSLELKSPLTSTVFPLPPATGTQFKLTPFSPLTTPSTSTTVSSPFQNSESNTETSDVASEQNMAAQSTDAASKPSPFEAGFFSSGMTQNMTSQNSSLAAAGTLDALSSPKLPEPTGNGSISTSTNIVSAVTKSPVLLPALSNSLIKNMTSSAVAAGFAESIFKQYPNASIEKSPITTVTTATTTQTSIPTFTLFTSQGNAKESPSVVSLNQGTTLMTSGGDVAPASVSVTPSGPPPPYPSTSGQLQDVLSKTDVTFNTAVTSTQSPVFEFSTKENNFEPESSKPSTTANPATNLFLQSGKLLSQADSLSNPNLAFNKTVTTQPSFNFSSSTGTSGGFNSSTPNNMFLSSQKSSAASGLSSGGLFTVTSQSGGTFSATTTTPSKLAFGVPATSASPFGLQNKGAGLASQTSSASLTTTNFGSSAQPALGAFSTPTTTNSTFGQFTPTSSGFDTTGNTFGSNNPSVSTFSSSTPGNTFGSTAPAASTFGATAQFGAAIQSGSASTFGATTQLGSTFGTTSQGVSTFGTTTQSGKTLSTTTQHGSTFGAGSQAAKTFGTTTQSGNIFGATTQSGNIFGPTTQPGNTFGATTQPGNTFGATTQPGNTFGAAAQPGNAFGATTKSGNAFGAASQSGNTFGATTQSGNTFGTTSQSGNTFGATSQSGNSFGATSQSGNSFGATTQSGNTFGATTQSGNSFGVTTQSGNAFGATTQSGSTFGTTTQSSSFGATTQTGSIFGQNNQPALAFGSSPQPSNTFGQQSSAFGTSAQPSNMFGATGQVTTNVFSNSSQPFGSLPLTQTNAFGSRISEEPFGTTTPTTTTQSRFTPVSDSKTIFSTPSFGSSQFTSPFGNTNAASLGTFGSPQTNFDGNKAATPAAPVFGSSISTASDTSFNSGSATPLNFSFNPKPTFNFGSGTTTTAFVSGSTSQPFVFTGGATQGTPIGGALPMASPFFSIGTGNRDRNKLTTKKRFPRK